jgi:citrate synthase
LHAEPSSTLTVRDNRTGRTYELDIRDSAIRATDLRRIKGDDADHGLMTYDPGWSTPR